MADKVDQQVIDEFRRNSLLLDMLTFDDTISPGTGGSTLTYGYVRLETPSTCAVRTINTEYTPGEAKRKDSYAKAVILGGSFGIDRVIAETSGAVNEVQFQLEEKVKAGSNLFHYLVINGTNDGSATEEKAKNTFDGLKKILTGSETEITSEVDLSSSDLVDQNYNAFLDELDTFLSKLDGKPSILMMNDKMLTKVRACARRAGYYERTKDDFGRTVEAYNGIPMVDLGQYYNGTENLDVVETSTPGSGTYGETSIYAVSLGLNAFHGISVDGSKMIKTHLPDFSTAGAVKEGDVELIAGAVLKNSKKAGVLKGIKVLPSTD